MALILSEKDNIFQFICKNLQKHWDPKLVDLRKRVRLVADLEKWRTDVEEIWSQKVNEKFYSVYFDDEYVCRVGSYTSPWQLELMFLKGVLELYQNNKIYFDQTQYKQEDELVKQLKHDSKESLRIANEKVDTLAIPSEAKQALKELNKEDLQTKTIGGNELKAASAKYETAWWCWWNRNRAV